MATPLDQLECSAESDSLGCEASAFVIAMAEALGTFGTPAHRLEEAMASLSQRLGLEAQIFAMPTAVFVSLRKPPARAETVLIRVQPGEVNLERLVDIDEILVDVAEGRCSAAEGNARLAEVLSKPQRFGTGLMLASFGVASACASRFFGGGVREIMASGLIGLAAGVLIVVASRRRESARLIDFMCGIIASAGAVLCAKAFGPLATEVVTVAGLIVLIPGLTLTMAINELATRNLVAGTARIMSAFTVLVSIGFGVALGTRLGGLMGTSSVTNPTHPLPEWTLFPALIITPIALSVLFKARPRDIPVLMCSGAIAFLSAKYGSQLLGPELGVCLGAFLTGLYSNAYSRFAEKPVAVPAMPGIMLLVPGSVSFQSLNAFLANDALGGVETAFLTILLAMSLVVGLMLSNVAMPPRRSL